MKGKQLKTLVNSATFALLISIALFVYEMSNSTKETERIVDNLVVIQNSLSTRYLGLFPEYIDNINELLDGAVKHQCKSDERDSVIIFEDVVYYGIRSDALGFRKMLENLLTLSNAGCHVTVAYYDVEGVPFKHMIRDKLISLEYQREFQGEIFLYKDKKQQLKKEVGLLDRNLSRSDFTAKVDSLMDELFGGTLLMKLYDGSPMAFRGIDDEDGFVDSLFSQYYYELTRSSKADAIYKNIDGMLKPLPQNEDNDHWIDKRINQLCMELDSVKRYYMEKPHKRVTYADFLNMYKEISVMICNVFAEQPNMELVPLNENLMMCCWMTIIGKEKRAIIAFPSKYSTDEIGFISQDAAIAKYVQTMLKGVKGRSE